MRHIIFPLFLLLALLALLSCKPFSGACAAGWTKCGGGCMPQGNTCCGGSGVSCAPGKVCVYDAGGPTLPEWRCQ